MDTPNLFENLQIEQVDIERVKPYERNTKVHDEKQIAQLADNMKRLGYWVPIVVDKDMVVISGHARLAALKLLGAKTAPVIVASRLSDDDVRTLRLADNKLNESPWDMETLKLELEAIGNELGQLAGFPALEIGDIAEPEVDENTVDESFNTFLNNTIKQIVLYFESEQYENIVNRLNNLRNAMGVESNTEVFIKLLEHYENAGGNSIQE